MFGNVRNARVPSSGILFSRTYVRFQTLDPLQCTQFEREKINIIHVLLVIDNVVVQTLETCIGIGSLLASSLRP